MTHGGPTESFNRRACQTHKRVGTFSPISQTLRTEGELETEFNHVVNNLINIWLFNEASVKTLEQGDSESFQVDEHIDVLGGVCAWIPGGERT